jgi:hypothetical protein
MSSYLGKKFFFVLVGLVFVFACNLGTPAGPAPAAPAFDATKASLELEATSMALQLTQAAVDNQPATLPVAPTAVPPTAPPPVQAPTAAPQPTAIPPTESNMPDFDTWMKSASVLLFEDMAGQFDVYRYVPIALQGMGLSYIDKADALGRFKNELLSNGPRGEGWDLIIAAKEIRSELQGEFYEYLNDGITKGSSVILEEWDMDNLAGGKLSLLTGRCGVDFDRNWADNNIEDTVIYALNGSHRAHHFPNEGLSLTKVTGYWLGWDLGDRMRLAPGGGATALWSLYGKENGTDIVAVSCINDRFIIQTYATHSYSQDRVVRVWQNYIYSTLRARYDYLAAHQ